MSKFTFYYGCMGSGKSLDLIRTNFNYEEKGMRVLVFKPDIDTREGIEECIISTRVGLTLKAEWIPSKLSGDEIAKLVKTHSIVKHNGLTDVVLVDEAQFLTREQVIALKYFSLESGIPFIFYGLKTDFQGYQFPGTEALRSGFCEKEQELITMCACGKPARQNARVVNGKIIREGEQVVIEGEAQYVAVCNRCYLMKENI